MAETCRQPNKTDTKTAVVEELKTNLMSLVIFYFTYYLLNMFRTLICPSSGACDCVDGLPHRLFCSLFVVCWGLLRMMFGGVRLHVVAQ